MATNMMVTGTYLGNGTSVTVLTPFRPKYIELMSAEEVGAETIAWKNDQMPTDIYYEFVNIGAYQGPSGGDTGITITDTGFTIGDVTTINGSGNNYTWTAWG